MSFGKDPGKESAKVANATAARWEWDLATGRITWSDGVFALLGLPPGSIAPSWEELAARMHPADRPDALDDTLLELLLDCQFRVMRPDSSERWLLSKGEVFSDALGTPAWAEGALLDVTNLRTKEAEQSRWDDRYRAITAASFMGIWAANRDGRLSESTFLQHLTGMPEPDARSSWLDLIHEDDRPAVDAACQEMVRLGCEAKFGMRLRQRNGTYKWCLATAVPIFESDGSLREWAGTIQDIDEQRKSQEWLRLKRLELHLAKSLLNFVTWELDVSSGILSWSENAAAVFGVTSGPVTSLRERMDEEGATAFFRGLSDSIATASQFDASIRFRLPSGEWRCARARGMALPNSQSHPTHVVGVLADDTQHMDLDQARKEGAALKSLCRALGRAAGDIVYLFETDGRTPDATEWRSYTAQRDSTAWKWLDAVHPSDREAVRAFINWQIDSRRSGSINCRLRNRTGEYAKFRFRMVPVVTESGSIARWVAAWRKLASRSQRPEPADAIAANEDGITGTQVRCARALVKWSVRELATHSGVSSATIRRIEEDEEFTPMRDEKVLLLQATLENEGVVFTTQPNGLRTVGYMPLSNARKA